MKILSSLASTARRANLAGQRRRRTCALSLMLLEDRQLLATGALGIDLASTLGYVNLMQETRPGRR